MINLENLPHASFTSEAAYKEQGSYALDYQNAVDAYTKDGCEITLWESLRAIGFTDAQCQWHAERRGEYEGTLYATVEDLDRTDAYQEGKQARLDGKHKLANPYPVNTDVREFWDAGWERADTDPKVW